MDRLIEAKKAERAQVDDMWPTDDIIRTREELADQLRALADLSAMAKLYGFDIGQPASDAREAVQWTYFGYLGAIKEANGAAMSIGRISTFLDAYIERDIREGRLDEAGAQELIDQLVVKLRIVRFLRTPTTTRCSPATPTGRPSARRGMDLDGRTAGDAHQLPNVAHAHQSRPGDRSDGALVAAHAGRVQALLHPPVGQDVLDPVRERRPHAAQMGRRLRHRLLRLGHAAGQADAVLRGPREPRQMHALRHQWRAGRSGGDQVRPPAPCVGDVLAYDDVARSSTT